jgi:transposase
MLSMTQPLSNDLRVRIVAAYKRKEGSYQELAERFNVGRASVYRLLRRFGETCSVEPAPRGGGNPAVIRPDDVDTLAELVANYQDSSTETLAILWFERTGKRVSRSSMYRALKRFGLSYKKKVSLRLSDCDQKCRKKGRNLPS